MNHPAALRRFRFAGMGATLAICVALPVFAPSARCGSQDRPAATGAPAVPKPIPAGGVSLLPADALSALALVGQTQAVEKTRVPVSGQPFSEALRLQTRPDARFATPYAAQIQASATGPVKKGDVLFAAFFVRTVAGGQAETGEGQTEFVFERGSEPFTKAASVGVQAPRDAWREITVPFVAGKDLPTGAAHVSFRLGYPNQTLEIGGVRLLNYENRVALSDLPRSRATYAGREPNAAWRSAAQARIRQIRMADLAVRVVDARGRPVPGATVAVRMKRHAFPFGSAVAADMLLGDGPDPRRYQEMVPKLFNRVVMENDLKWPQWESNPERAKRGVARLRERNIEVRGHNLVWPGWRWLPADIRTLAGDKAALAKRVRDHITGEASALRGQLVEWDVVNEPFANHDLQDILGRDSLVEWFRLARQADPKPILFLNDYPPLDGGLVGNAHLDNFEQTIRFLKDGGAPLGGIGFQGHFGGSVVPPARVVAGLDRFGKFNLPIAITEFDINTNDDELQADYLRDFYSAAFSHPAVNQIILWGFWEGRHWLPDAALWRRDWTIKPSGQAYQDLVFRTWWTNADGKTNASGAYAVRGFLGDYDVNVSANGKTITVPVRLARGARAPLTIMLR